MRSLSLNLKNVQRVYALHWCCQSKWTGLESGDMSVG